MAGARRTRQFGRRDSADTGEVDAPGKLKGQTAAVTPRGTLRTKVSMSFETSSLSASNSEGIPHAFSTTCSAMELHSQSPA